MKKESKTHDLNIKIHLDKNTKSSFIAKKAKKEENKSLIIIAFICLFIALVSSPTICIFSLICVVPFYLALALLVNWRA